MEAYSSRRNHGGVKDIDIVCFEVYGIEGLILVREDDVHFRRIGYYSLLDLKVWQQWEEREGLPAQLSWAAPGSRGTACII